MFFYFENFRNKILNMGSGSIFKNLKTDYIKDLNIVIPPIDLLKISKEFHSKLSDQILVNSKQNQELSALRDWLLPMLMNGQVQIDDQVEKKYEMKESEVGMAAEPGERYGEGNLE
jgi:type I restriction enzyme S subunit